MMRVAGDTLSPDNGGDSGPDYSEPFVNSEIRGSFRRATPRSIRRRRWYQALNGCPTLC